MSSSFILWIILACEIGFWVFLLFGLCARYVWQWRTVSTVALYLVPWIDVVLLLAVIADLRAGSVATFAHGLAAAYIGFTFGFGRATLAWADRTFAHRFAGGPKPEKPPSYGKALFVSELRWFGRCLVAVLTTMALAQLAIVLVDDPSRTEAFLLWARLPLVTAVLWLLFGPVWSVAFHWRAPKTGRNA